MPEIKTWEHSICGQRVDSIGEPVSCDNPECLDPDGGEWTIVSE